MHEVYVSHKGTKKHKGNFLQIAQNNSDKTESLRNSFSLVLCGENKKQKGTKNNPCAFIIYSEILIVAYRNCSGFTREGLSVPATIVLELIAME